MPGFAGDKIAYQTELGRYPLTYQIQWLSSRRSRVQAQIIIPVSPEKIWLVLTDYNHLAEFLPNVEESQVLRHEGNLVLLLQKGRIWLPGYGRKVQVLFRVTEDKPRRLRFQAIEGDFVIHEGGWDLISTKQGTQLVYQVTVEPGFPMPTWVMKQLQREMIKETFRSILKRCLDHS